MQYSYNFTPLLKKYIIIFSYKLCFSFAVLFGLKTKMRLSLRVMWKNTILILKKLRRISFSFVIFFQLDFEPGSICAHYYLRLVIFRV